MYNTIVFSILQLFPNWMTILESLVPMYSVDDYESMLLVAGYTPVIICLLQSALAYTVCT